MRFLLTKRKSIWSITELRMVKALKRKWMHTVSTEHIPNCCRGITSIVAHNCWMLIVGLTSTILRYSFWWCSSSWFLSAVSFFGKFSACISTSARLLHYFPYNFLINHFWTYLHRKIFKFLLPTRCRNLAAYLIRNAHCNKVSSTLFDA